MGQILSSSPHSAAGPNHAAADLSAGEGQAARAVLLLVVALTPVLFLYRSVESFESVKTAFVQLSALALLGLGLSACGSRQSLTKRWRELVGCPVSLAVVAGCLTALVATVTSLAPRTSWQGFPGSHAGLPSVLALAVLFFASRAVTAHRVQRHEVLAGVAVALGLITGYALVQAGGCDPFGWDGESTFGRWRRPSGTIGHANWLAAYVAMTLPLLAWLCWQVPPARRRGVAIAGAGLLTLAILVVVMSLSRAAWLAALLAGGMLLVGLPGARRKQVFTPAAVVTGLVGSGLLAAALVFPDSLGASLLQRFQRIGDPSGRSYIWGAAWTAFLDRPWTGHGLDTFGLIFPRYRAAEFWQIEWNHLAYRAHNDFLEALACQGIAGGLAYLLLPISLARAAWIAWRRRPDERLAVVALAAAVLAYYVSNLVGFTTASSSALLAICAGMLAALYQPMATTEDASPVCATLRPGWLVALAGAGTAVFVLNLLTGSIDAPLPTLISGLAVALTGGTGLYLACKTLPEGDRTGQAEVRISRRGVLIGAVLAPMAWSVLAPVAANVCVWQGEHRLTASPVAALPWFDRAIQLAGGHSQFWSKRALALHLASRTASDERAALDLLRRADENASQACGLSPAQAERWIQRARPGIELLKRRHIDATRLLGDFEQALALDPHNSIYLAEAGRAAILCGETRRAETYLHQALRLDPQLGEVHFGLAALAMTRQQTGEVWSHFQRAMQAGRWACRDEAYPQMRLLQAYQCLQVNALGYVVKITDEVLRLKPGQPTARQLRDIALERLERNPSAWQEFYTAEQQAKSQRRTD